MKLRRYGDLFFLSFSASSPGAVCAFTSAPYSTTVTPHATHMHNVRTWRAQERVHAFSPPSPHLSTATLLLSPVWFSSVQSSTGKRSVANTLTPSNQLTTVNFHQGQMRFIRVPGTLGGDAACLVSWVTGVNGPRWTRHLLYCNHADTFPTANDMFLLLCPQNGGQNLTG